MAAVQALALSLAAGGEIESAGVVLFMNVVLSTVRRTPPDLTWTAMGCVDQDAA